MFPSDLEVTIEAFLQARLRLANVDLVAMPARSLVDGAVLVALSTIDALAVTDMEPCLAIAVSIGAILGADAAHHLPSKISREDRLEVGKAMICHPDP